MGADFALSQTHPAGAYRPARGTTVRPREGDYTHSQQQQPSQRFPAERRYEGEALDASQSLALGADGTAGLLYPAEALSDGMFLQVRALHSPIILQACTWSQSYGPLLQLAVLRSEVAGRVVGKSGSILELVRVKSGASIVIDKAEQGAYDPQRKVHMVAC